MFITSGNGGIYDRCRTTTAGSLLPRDIRTRTSVSGESSRARSRRDFQGNIPCFDTKFGKDSLEMLGDHLRLRPEYHGYRAIILTFSHPR
jgi:hypothetical protein